jgi:hypothetical protein
MAAQEPQPITVLLQQWRSGDPSALAAKFLAKGSLHQALSFYKEISNRRPFSNQSRKLEQKT